MIVGSFIRLCLSILSLCGSGTGQLSHAIALFLSFQRIKCVILALFCSFFCPNFSLFSPSVPTSMPVLERQQTFWVQIKTARMFHVKHLKSIEIWVRKALFFHPIRYERPFGDLPTPLSIEIALLFPTQPLTPYILRAFSRCPTPFHAFSMYFCLSSPIFKRFCFISYS